MDTFCLTFMTNNRSPKKQKIAVSRTAQMRFEIFYGKQCQVRISIKIGRTSRQVKLDNVMSYHCKL